MYQESNPMIQPQHPDVPSSRSPYQSLHQVHPLPQHMVNPPQQLSTFADPQNTQIIPDLSQQQQFNPNYMPQALAGQSMGVINQYNSMQPQHMGNAYQQPSAFSDPQNAQISPDLSQQQPLNGSYMPQTLPGQSMGMINQENSIQPQHMGNSFQQPSTFSDPQNAQISPDMSQQQPLNGSYMPQALAGQSMGVMNQMQPMQPMQTVVNIPEELITGKERIKTGWERLEERDGVFIEQKKETMEILRTERVRSDYSIYGLSVDGERRGKKIYKGRELHSGRDEFCMTKGCSFFELKINLADGDDEKTPFLYITRPSSCTCLCFGRPGLKVSYVENGKNLYLGRIKDTFGFCSIVLQIFDEDNSLKYTIEAWSCQCGLMFDCPMDCCHDVGFYIRDGMGKTLATMEKKRQGCTAPKMDRKNNFAVRFPEKASKEDKALIMAAAFLLDYRYFNDN